MPWMCAIYCCCLLCSESKSNFSFYYLGFVAFPVSSNPIHTVSNCKRSKRIFTVTTNTYYYFRYLKEVAEEEERKRVEKAIKRSIIGRIIYVRINPHPPFQGKKKPAV